jgi:hypothetical protein
MEKTGKIEKTGDCNVYRMGKPVTTMFIEFII